MLRMKMLWALKLHEICLLFLGSKECFGEPKDLTQKENVSSSSKTEKMDSDSNTKEALGKENVEKIDSDSNIKEAADESVKKRDKV